MGVAWNDERLVLYVVHELMLIDVGGHRLPGMLPKEHLIEDYSCRPNIPLQEVLGFLTLQRYGRHVELPIVLLGTGVPMPIVWLLVVRSLINPKSPNFT